MSEIREPPVFIITGGNKLTGNIEVSGSKNAALSILSASLLCSGQSILRNVPLTSDILATIDLMRKLNVEVNVLDDTTLQIDASSMHNNDISGDLTCKTRASILLLGTLLAKNYRVHIGLPGGDAIGSRPLDLHLMGLKTLGAELNFFNSYIEAKAKELHGKYIFLDYPSSTATEILMIVAVIAKGLTIIDNAETKPEIVDLANFLKKAGAKIVGAGTSTIKITGVSELKGVNHVIIPDYLEAGTFMIASAITGGNLLIKDAIYDHLRPLVAKLQESGVCINRTSSYIEVTCKNSIKAINVIATKPFPGLYSDLQPLIVSLLTKANGTSVVRDLVFTKRFCYVSELEKMGAKIKLLDSGISISGVQKLSGASVTATDIRGGAALILAGLAAEGETILNGCFHVERAYEKIHEKLYNVGAKITRI